MVLRAVFVPPLCHSHTEITRHNTTNPATTFLLLDIVLLTSRRAGIPWGKVVVSTAIGWFCGAKFHTGKQKKKMNAKHKSDQKQLYTQYYNDVYTLKEENDQLKSALEQLGYKVR